MSSTDDDTFPIGIDLCLNGQKQFELKPGELVPPCPFLFILNNFGTLLVYHVYNQQQQQTTLCKQAIALPAPTQVPKVVDQKPIASSTTNLSSGNQFSFGLQLNKPQPSGPPPPFGAQNSLFSMTPNLSLQNLNVPAQTSSQQQVSSQDLQKINSPLKLNTTFSMPVPKTPIHQQIPQQPQQQQQQVQQQQKNIIEQDSKPQSKKEDDSLNIDSKLQAFTNELKEFKEKIKRMSDPTKDFDNKFGRKTTEGQNKFNDVEDEMRVSYQI